MKQLPTFSEFQKQDNNSATGSNKVALLMLLIVVLIAILSSCNAGKQHLSIDTYVDGVVKSDSLNKVSKIEAQRFIDSVNHKN